MKKRISNENYLLVKLKNVIPDMLKIYIKKKFCLFKDIVMRSSNLQTKGNWKQNPVI